MLSFFRDPLTDSLVSVGIPLSDSDVSVGINDLILWFSVGILYSVVSVGILYLVLAL